MGIAVTGVGIVSALGIGALDNFRALSKGVSGISLLPEILQTENFLPVGELHLTNQQLHEAAGISVKENLSRTALLGILAVREALNDTAARGNVSVVSKDAKIGLVSATSVGGMDLTEHFFRKFMEDESSGRLRDVRMHDCASSTEAIRTYCNINGYSTTISTACSSAANAFITGARLLEHRVVDFAVVGGCDALSAFTLNGFNSLKIIDTQRCRPFDASRAGLNLGEGAGYVVLRRDEDAENCYCHLTGYSNRNDAYHQTASSAEGDGAFLAMESALGMAGVDISEVSYINAHGTGTGNNDASESAAFIRLFGQNVPPFSSTKAFTGHTLAAAGGIEAVLSVLSIDGGILYPNLNFTTPIPEYGLKPVTAFEVGVDISCVLSNSFGFGGNCTSLVFAK